MSPIDTAVSCDAGAPVAGQSPTPTSASTQSLTQAWTPPRAPPRALRGRGREQPLQVERRIGVDDEARKELIERRWRRAQPWAASRSTSTPVSVNVFQRMSSCAVGRSSAPKSRIVTSPDEPGAGSGRERAGGDATLGAHRAARHDDVGLHFEIGRSGRRSTPSTSIFQSIANGRVASVPTARARPADPMRAREIDRALRAAHVAEVFQQRSALPGSAA